MMVSDMFLFAFFLLIGAFLFVLVLGEFVRQIVEEREYRQWEKQDAKSTRKKR